MLRLRWTSLFWIVCAAACAGPDPDDAGPARDAGFAADALPAADAQPPRDAEPDAGPLDGEVTDGSVPDGGPDAGPEDAGDPCAPLARSEVHTAFSAPLGRLGERCVSELSAPEAAQVGAWLSARVTDLLRDDALVYDGAAAGLCRCALDPLACDDPDPFRALASCSTVVTGTIAEGNVCTGSRCAAGLECWRSFEDAPPSCEGVCVRPRSAGEDCQPPFGDPYPCVPGYYCFDDDGSYSCEPLIELGESCRFGRRCRGDRDAFLYSTTVCDFSSEVPICVERGRATSSCANVTCHELYACDSNSTCVLKPRGGEACDLPVADPMGPADLRLNAEAALEACLLNPTNASPGDYCVLQDTTTGAATCVPAPRATETCGIGVGLSAVCDGRNICVGIDPGNLVPGTGTCSDPLADGAACNDQWRDDVFGAQCENGECRFGDPAVCGPHNPNGICVND